MAENSEMTNKPALSKVSLISEEEKGALRRQTAAVLPDSPAAAGMPASAVKPAFWRGFVGEKYSLVAFFNRMANDMNTTIGEIAALFAAAGERIDGSEAALGDHKTDPTAHAELFAAADKKIGENQAALGAHNTDSNAHSNILNRTALINKIGRVVDNHGTEWQEGVGLMTETQSKNLDTLTKLLSEDHEGTINTIEEVFKVFKGYSEEVNMVKILADKADASDLSELGETVSQMYIKPGGGEYSIVQFDDSDDPEAHPPNYTDATHAAVFGNNNIIKITPANEPTNSFIGGGLGNEVYAKNAFIGGGNYNTIGDQKTNLTRAGIIAGNKNKIQGASSYSFIGSGNVNTIINGLASAIVGGQSHSINNQYSFIGGGNTNNISGSSSAIDGGNSNKIANKCGFIGGGEANSVLKDCGAAIAGSDNTVSGERSVIAGGYSNTTKGLKSFVGGGADNAASGENSAIIGGTDSAVSNESSVIAGGHANVLNGKKGFIAAGDHNTVDGIGPFAQGYRNFINASVGVAIGADNTIGSEYGIVFRTFAIGEGLWSDVDYQTLLGRWNQPDEDAAVIIGGGKDGNRKNILTVPRTGATRLAVNSDVVTVGSFLGVAKSKIPNAESVASGEAGFMTRTQSDRLQALHNLLGDNPDEVVNTINEVFKIFDGYPDTANIVNTLAAKADKKAVEDLVGDISSALDELHTYAEALTNGGNV